MYEIGTKIKYYRERAGLSQKEFAQQINQKNSTVSNWERGLTRPNVDVLADICAALKVSPDELLDIRLNPEDMDEHEKKVILAYRAKVNLQQAVDILLGVDSQHVDTQQNVVPFYAVARDGRTFQGTVDAAIAEEHKKIAKEALSNPKHPEI